VIEAMACAKPIVVTASGGLRDMIDDDGGRRVEPGNVAQLADALLEILSSAPLRQEMGAHNRATAEREYDWPRVIEKLEGIYEWVVRRRAAR
jgi:glycosyltransferase involved in cell wall biosynthesis